MSEATRIKIKQMDNRVATTGVHFGGSPERRKLEVGEVVEISSEEAKLAKQIVDTGLVEITRDKVTRPLDFESAREAKLCSPSFRVITDDDARDRNQAMEKVSARLEKAASAKIREEKAKSAIDDPDLALSTDEVIQTTSTSPRRRRAPKEEGAKNGAKT